MNSFFWLTFCERFLNRKLYLLPVQPHISRQSLDETNCGERANIPSSCSKKATPYIVHWWGCLSLQPACSKPQTAVRRANEFAQRAGRALRHHWVSESIELSILWPMDFLSGQTPCLNFLISEGLKTERQLTCQESRWDSSALLQWVNMRPLTAPLFFSLQLSP